LVEDANLLVRGADALIIDLQERLIGWGKRYDDLLARYDALTQHTASVATAAKRERSKLTQAIRDQARQPDGSIDPRLVNHFRREANRLLNSGAKEKDVIEQISQWQTTEHQDALSPELMAALAEVP
jgi:hypothetical protein